MLRKCLLFFFVLIIYVKITSPQVLTSSKIYYNVRTASMDGNKFVVTYQLSQSSSVIYGQIYSPMEPYITYPRFEVINKVGSEIMNSSVNVFNSSTISFTWTMKDATTEGWDTFIRFASFLEISITFTNTFKGNGVTTNDQKISTTCALSDGNIAFVWEAREDKTYERTKCRIFDLNGAEKVGGNYINPTSPFPESESDCTTVPDKLFISWKSLMSDGTYAIKYVYYDNIKTIKVNKDICAAPCANATSSVKISKTPDGSFVVASDYNNNIYANFENGSRMQVNIVTGINTLPDVGISKGDIYVSWQHKDNPTSTAQIYLRKINSSGISLFGAEYIVKDPLNLGLVSPMLDGRADNNSYIIFQTVTGSLQYQYLSYSCNDKLVSTTTNPFDLDMYDGVGVFSSSIIFTELSTECKITYNGDDVIINTVYSTSISFKITLNSSSTSCIYIFKTGHSNSAVSPTCTLEVNFQCHRNCITCEAVGGTDIDNKCTSCISNLYLLNKNCYLTCPDGYFGDNSFKCNACTTPGCKSCTSTQCNSCLVNFFYHISYKVCYRFCPNGTFGNTTTKICEVCSGNCDVCTTANDCVTCRNGYYKDIINNTCYPCISGCSRCSDDQTCIQCTGIYYLNPTSNVCETTCPDGYYADLLEKKCIACDSKCMKCSGRDTCTECLIGLFLDRSTNTCGSLCPDGFYRNLLTKTCDSCPSNCQTCRDGNTCTICIRGYFLNPSSNKCNKCVPNCDVCNDDRICHMCSQEFYLFPSDGKCYSECPAKSYIDPSSPTCLSCYFNVAQCPGVTLCETGLMVNESLGICVKCNENCKACTNINPCTECLENHYYHSAHKKCYKDCPIGMYENTTLGFCSACVPNCDICSDGQLCESCSAGFFFLKSDGNCYNPCPDSYFGNTVSLLCQSCIPNCDKCSSSVSCDKCSSNYYLLDSDAKCYTSCPTEYFANSSSRKCEKCPPNCKQCTDGSKCSECLNSYFLLESNSKCFLSCPLFFYGDPVSKKCQKCRDNCKKCTNSASCEECESQYSLLKAEDKCYKSCPTGFYEDASTYSFKTCQGCPQNCDVCLNKQECTKCSQNFYYSPLDKKCYGTCPTNSITNKSTMTCEPICPDGYYDPTSQVCMPCPDHCEKCLDSKRCTKCKGSGPCQNDGRCSINQDDHTFKCHCLPQFTGEMCDTKIPLNEALSQIDQNSELSNDHINLLANINPLEITNIEEATKLVTEVAKNQMELMKTGQIPLNPEILKVSNTAFELKLSKISFNSTELLDKESLQKDINDMKNSVSSFTETLISNSDLSNGTTISNNLFSLQYASTSDSNKQQLEEMAYLNKISILDFSDCEKLLKEFYGIPKDLSLIIKKIDFSSKMSISDLNQTNVNKSDSIVVEFLDPITKVKLDTDVCNEVNTTVKAANPKLQNMNITKFKKLAESNLDVLNPQSPAFKSRCVIVKDPNTGMDTTINYRIGNYFQNTSASCNSNCQYQGLNDKGYVICNCMGLSKDEKTANSMEDFILSKIPKFNIEIIECYYVGLKYPDLFHNPGFYVGILFTLSGIIIAFLARKYSYHLLRNSFKDVLFSDCQFYDDEEMTKEDYFNFNIKKPVRDPDTFKKIQACIEDVQVRPVNNKNELRLPIKKRKNKPAKVGAPKNEFEPNSKEPDCTKSSSDVVSSSEIALNKVGDNVKKYFLFKKKQEKKNKKNKRIEKQILQEDAVINDIKNFRLNRRNIYERYPGHAPTLRDYDALSPFDAVICDRRTFRQLFWSMLMEEHVIFALFKKTILSPLWVKIVYFFFNLTLIFAINALFFTDDYIEKRADNAGQSSGFFYTLVEEFPKTLFSLIITNIILFILDFIRRVPFYIERDLNDSLKTRRVDLTRKALKVYDRRMMPRYKAFLIATIIINVICWYYVIVFCGVYVSSSTGWVQGAVIGLALDWCCFSLFIPILRTGIRLIVRKYKSMRFLVFIEYLLWIRDFVC